MKAVITGGAGFIGSHLSERLLEMGHEVVIIDNLSTGRIQNIIGFLDRIHFEVADLSVKGSWMHLIAQSDVVFHLASLADIVPSIEMPSKYFDSNVTSTMNIAEAAKINKTTVIYAASASCYGIAKTIPTPESETISVEYPYALTKRLGEEVVMHWSKVYNFRAVSTRFFNVYGTRSRTSGSYGAVFGVFLAQKLAGQPFTVVGDGSQKRDFTYVSDIVEGLILAYQNGSSGEVYNLGSGKPNSINYLTQLLGGRVVYVPKRPGEPDITFADISKAKSNLNYNPSVSFEQGVQKVLQNIEYWRSAPVWSPDSIASATKSWFEHLA